jgi:hypothetical protein
MSLWKNKTTWEVLSEDFDLREGIEGAVKEFAGTAVEESVKSLLSHATNEAIVLAGAAALKSVGGDIAVGVIKMLCPRQLFPCRNSDAGWGDG